jgi:hypothetical protein
MEVCIPPFLLGRYGLPWKFNHLVATRCHLVKTMPTRSLRVAEWVENEKLLIQKVLLLFTLP